MKRTAWLVAAFAAGMIVNAAAARTSAETLPLPSWVRNGACYLTANSGGNEAVLEIQGAWVKTQTAPNGTEQWRNLAVAPWLKRLPDRSCGRTR